MRNHDPFWALQAAVNANAEQIHREAATLHRIGFTWNELAILNASKHQIKHQNPRFSYPQVVIKAMLEGEN
jgi:hypothetical protein